MAAPPHLAHVYLERPVDIAVVRTARIAVDRNGVDMGARRGAKGLLGVRLRMHSPEPQACTSVAAQVEPAETALLAVGQLVIGAEFFATVGSPGSGDGALADEDGEILVDEFLDAIESGGGLLGGVWVLVNGRAFFRSKSVLVCQKK